MEPLAKKVVKLRPIDIVLPEGSTETDIACYISMDQAFVDVISPIKADITEENSLKLYPKSRIENVMFMVKSMGSTENNLGSIIVPIKNFMARGLQKDARGLIYQWFAISDDID
jgi:hypothetical protein